jgi:hypothetical protein
LNAGSGKSVFVGSGADEAIVRGNILDTFLTDVKSWMDGHKHLYTIALHPDPLGDVTSTTAPLTSSTSIPGNLLSDDHKVK